MARVRGALGPGRMRALGGLGGLLACGVAGVTVAYSQKPAGAPLKPPVDPAAPLGAAAHASASPGLVIPATPVCGGAARGDAAYGSGMSGTPAEMDPQVRGAVVAWLAARTRAARLAVLHPLTADQRQQVMAVLRSMGRSRNGSAAHCHATPAPYADGADAPDAGDAGGAGPAPMIQPNVVSGGPTAAPVTNSYVS